MRYWQPWGSADLDASYVNGNPAIGLRGTIPPSGSVEPRMREIVNLIKNSGLTENTDDLEQFIQAARSQRINYAVDVGDVNALSVICVPTVTSLMSGFPLRVLVSKTNTSAATIRINGLGPFYILRANGANVTAGDLVAGSVVELVYDGSFFQVTNFQGLVAEVENNYFYNVNIPYVASTGTTNDLVGVYDPVIASLIAGLVIECKANATNTGPCTITVNSNPAKAIKSGDLQALIAGQISNGMVALLVYDGVQFQLINPAIPRITSLTGVRIAKRQISQDTDFQIVTPGTYAECYRVSYVPVSANNKIRLQITGAGGIPYPNPPYYDFPDAALRFLPDFSADGGLTWQTPQSPISEPTGTSGQPLDLSNLPFEAISPNFPANPGWIWWGMRISAIKAFDFNFSILAEITVPAGPPASLIFRLLMNDISNNTLMNTQLRGGTIFDITEYTTGE